MTIATARGDSSSAIDASVTNSNLFTWNGGANSITLNGGSFFTNTGAGALNLNTTVTNTGVAGAGTLANAATINVNGPGVVTRISTPFNNTRHRECRRAAR